MEYRGDVLPHSNGTASLQTIRRTTEQRYDVSAPMVSDIFGLVHSLLLQSYPLILILPVRTVSCVCKVGTVGKISDYQPEGTGFNRPFTARGHMIWYKIHHTGEQKDFTRLHWEI